MYYLYKVDLPELKDEMTPKPKTDLISKTSLVYMYTKDREHHYKFRSVTFPGIISQID